MSIKYLLITALDCSPACLAGGCGPCIVTFSLWGPFHLLLCLQGCRPRGHSTHSTHCFQQMTAKTLYYKMVHLLPFLRFRQPATPTSEGVSFESRRHIFIRYRNKNISSACFFLTLGKKPTSTDKQLGFEVI